MSVRFGSSVVQFVCLELSSYFFKKSISIFFGNRTNHPDFWNDFWKGDTPWPPLGGCSGRIPSLYITLFNCASAHCIRPAGVRGQSPLFKFLAITISADKLAIHVYNFLGTFISTIFFLTFVTYFDVIVAFATSVTIKYNIYFVVVHFNINRCIYLY